MYLRLAAYQPTFLSSINILEQAVYEYVPYSCTQLGYEYYLEVVECPAWALGLSSHLKFFFCGHYGE